jgi:2-dehydro-3-deoxyphosphooctonate aldolase (KDO 8-P synthase)
MKGEVSVGELVIGGGRPLVLIAGPCVIENEEATLAVAERLRDLAAELKVGLIFKGSFDKANRTSVDAFRGPGLTEGLGILAQVKKHYGLPVLSDVHETGQLEAAADVLDVIQIPAFLCRQTDLLIAAGNTGRVINVKKGQFLAPWDMTNAVTKIRSTGNEKILLTERGTTFGYNNLVVDMRSFPIMAKTGCPVVFDATHSVQLPGGAGGSSGGQREFVADLSRAAVAVGVDALFLEVHEDPDRALCDGPNSLALDDLKSMLLEVMAIDAIVKERKNTWT